MADLREQLRARLHGRVCLVGVGNPDWGDDGLGVRLAEVLCPSATQSPATAANAKFAGPDGGMAGEPSACGPGPGFGFQISDFEFHRVLIAGTKPERFLEVISDGGFNAVLFLDAVEFGGPAGSVILLNSAEMESRFPQVSTHRISLGILARMIESRNSARVSLLGVQPESLRGGQGLSQPVQTTLEIVSALLAEILTGSEACAIILKGEPSGEATVSVRSWLREDARPSVCFSARAIQNPANPTWAGNAPPDSARRVTAASSVAGPTPAAA